MGDNGRTAIYVRQSEDKTGEGAAVSRQREDCINLARAKRWPDPEIFEDNSISATTGKTRPAFEELVGLIEAGEVTRLAVWHLDRLTRSMGDLTRVIEAGKKHNLTIASVKGTSLDLSDPSGVAVAQILTAVSTMETSHKGERQRRANRQRAEKGNAFWSRRPFGYDLDDEGAVIIVEAEANLIRSGADKVLAGSSVAALAREWEASGVKTTARSSKGWTVSTVRRILTNPRYAGVRTYNGVAVAQGEWQPILNMETHERLKLKLDDPRRRTSPAIGTAKWLLTGIVKCGRCGEAMYAAPATSQRYRVEKFGGRNVMVYRCPKKHMTRRLDLVDEVVESVIIGRLTAPDAADLFTVDDDLDELRLRLDDLRDRRDALTAMLADGLLSPVAVREQVTGLNLQMDELQRQLDRRLGSNPIAQVTTSSDPATTWESLPLDDKRAVIRLLIDVSILPAGKGARFDPAQVQIEWK